MRPPLAVLPAALSGLALIPCARALRAGYNFNPGWRLHVGEASGAADAWIGLLPSTTEADGIVAVIAQQPSLLRDQPHRPLSRAEAIPNPALRSRVRGGGVHEWQAFTPEEAVHHARSFPQW